MQSGSRHRGGRQGAEDSVPLAAGDGRIQEGDGDMRTGAIFARGICRALMWLVLVGAVVVLRAGPVAAQPLSAQTLEIEAGDFIEGGSTTVVVTLSAEVAANTSNPTNVQIEVSARKAGKDALWVQNSDATPAEDSDWTFAEANTTLDFEFSPNPGDESVRQDLAPKTVLLQTETTDPDAENEALVLIARQSAESTQFGFEQASVPVVIRDAQEQKYVLTWSSSTTTPMMEGDTVKVDLTADPPHVQGSTTLALQHGMSPLVESLSIEADPTATNGSPVVNGNSVTIGNGTDPDTTTNATITVETVANDMNRMDGDTVTLSAWSGQAGDGVMRDDIEIVLMDMHKLPKVTTTLVDANGMAVTGDMVTEGMNYMLTLTVVDDDGMATAATEDLTVTLTQSGGTADPQDDYSLGMSSITISTGDMSSAPVSLEVDLNDDIQDETLMFSAVVNGEDAMFGAPQDGLNPMDVLSLTIMDDSMKLIEVTSEAMTLIEDALQDMRDYNGSSNQINQASVGYLPLGGLFEAAPGYDVRIGIVSSDPSTVRLEDRRVRPPWHNPSDDVKLFADWGAERTATITLTGTAVPAMSSGVSSGQLSVDVAEITFDVTVEVVPPHEPRALMAEAGDGQVVLSWGNPEFRRDGGGVPRRYDYDIDASGEWKFVEGIDDTTTGGSVTVGGLTNGKRYVFRVRAGNSAGDGPPTAGVEATPMAAPEPPAGPQVTVKSVSAAASVAESGGLEVTVVAMVPAGTKGADGKVAPIASRPVAVTFPTDDASIMAGEDADAGELTTLGTMVWENIPRTEEASEATYEFRVAVGQDLDAEDEKFQVEVQIDGAPMRSKVVVIDDAQEQKYVLSLPVAAEGAIMEGKSGTVTLKADPKRTIDIPVTLVLEPNDPSMYTLSVANGEFGTSSLETTVGTKADSDRRDDTITVTAYMEREGELASLDITVTDANALPSVKATLVDKDGTALNPQPESVMEGETVMVMLTVVDKDGEATKAAEKLTITLTPSGTADVQDYRQSSQAIEIAMGSASSAAVELMVAEDQDVGAETLMFGRCRGRRGEERDGRRSRSRVCCR